MTLPVFPARLAEGVSGGPHLPVEIVTLTSGHEHRNRRTAHPLRAYVLPGTVRPLAEARALLSFFEAVNGSADPFLFRDPVWNVTSDGDRPSPIDLPLQADPADPTLYRLPSDSRFHRVRPQAETLLVAIDDEAVHQEEGWAWDDDKAGLRFVQSPDIGSVVTCGFRFHLLVRFDNQNLAFTSVSKGAGRHEDIHLREVLA